jgi:hypothetical protein
MNSNIAMILFFVLLILLALSFVPHPKLIEETSESNNSDWLIDNKFVQSIGENEDTFKIDLKNSITGEMQLIEVDQFVFVSLKIGARLDLIIKIRKYEPKKWFNILYLAHSNNQHRMVSQVKTKDGIMAYSDDSNDE